jgi:hypothetical protein
MSRSPNRGRDFDDNDYSDDGERNDDDEQHTQNVNGKLEKLQMKIDELQRELKHEKLEHEATKKRSNNDKEVEKYKKMVSRLKDDLDTALACGTSSSGGLSPELQKELYKYSIKNQFEIDGVRNAGNLTDDNAIAIIKNGSKEMKNLKQNLVDANSNVAITGSDTELSSRIRNLEYELRLALGLVEDIKALKAKLLQVLDRVRLEKEAKVKAENGLNHCKRKMEMLGDHIEKLMTHLKHEAASKIRSMEQTRITEKILNKFKEKFLVLSKKSAAKDRLVLELREGSKILEDQLRLMDEKYLELRTKLDYAREVSVKKVKAAEKTASDLRVKFALAGNTSILDNVNLPDIYSQGGGYSVGTGVSQSNDFMENNSFQSGSIGSRSAPGGNKNSQRNKMSHSMSSIPSKEEKIKEPDMDQILEKIRKKGGGQQEWTDEKLKDLRDGKTNYQL